MLDSLVIRLVVNRLWINDIQRYTDYLTSKHASKILTDAKVCRFQSDLASKYATKNTQVMNTRLTSQVFGFEDESHSILC